MRAAFLLLLAVILVLVVDALAFPAGVVTQRVQRHLRVRMIEPGPGLQRWHHLPLDGDMYVRVPGSAACVSVLNSLRPLIRGILSDPPLPVHATLRVPLVPLNFVAVVDRLGLQHCRAGCALGICGQHCGDGS